MDPFPIYSFCSLRSGLRAIGIVDITLSAVGIGAFSLLYYYPVDVDTGVKKPRHSSTPITCVRTNSTRSTYDLSFQVGMTLTVSALAGYLTLGFFFLLISIKVWRCLCIFNLAGQIVSISVHLGGLIALSVPGLCSLDNFRGNYDDDDQVLELVNTGLTIVTICTYKVFQIFMLFKFWTNGQHRHVSNKIGILKPPELQESLMTLMSEKPGRMSGAGFISDTTQESQISILGRESFIQNVTSSLSPPGITKTHRSSSGTEFQIQVPALWDQLEASSDNQNNQHPHPHKKTHRHHRKGTKGKLNSQNPNQGQSKGFEGNIKPAKGQNRIKKSGPSELEAARAFISQNDEGNNPSEVIKRPKSVSRRHQHSQGLNIDEVVVDGSQGGGGLEESIPPVDSSIQSSQMLSTSSLNVKKPSTSKKPAK